MLAAAELINNYQNVLEKIQLAQAESAYATNPPVELLAVSKKQSVEAVQALINKYPGILLGENYVQEYERKSLLLTGDFKVHLIGSLQSNKIKKAVALFDVIQSVASVKTAELISKEAQQLQKTQQIYLQVNISEDPRKAGFPSQQLAAIFTQLRLLPNLEILGLMTITSFYDVVEQVRPDFQRMHSLADLLSKTFQVPPFRLSMGMSADYQIAVEEGATLVRVGSDIFGARN